MNVSNTATSSYMASPSLTISDDGDLIKKPAFGQADSSAGARTADSTAAPSLVNNAQVNGASSSGVTASTSNVLSSMPVLNAVPTSTVATALSQAGSSNQLSSFQTPPSSQTSSSHPSPAPYEGFDYCQNCGHKGVKAAFYGKAKLFCSMSCQNGIKKQLVSTQGGIKRTVEALNTLSPSSSLILGSSGTVSQTSSISSELSNAAASADVTLTENGHSPSAPEGTDSANKPGAFQAIGEQSTKRLRTISTASTNSQLSNMESNASGSESNAVRPANSSAKISSQPFSFSAAAAATPSRSNSACSENRICPNLSKSTVFFDKHHSGKAFSSTVFSWTTCIDKDNAEAAPISAFKHCVLSSAWNRLIHDTIFEVPMRNVPPSVVEYFKKTGHTSTVACNWFAFPVKFAGYYVKLRYLGFDDDASQDFWMHLCDSRLQHVRWSSENQVPVVPPLEIFHKCENWNEYLMKKLINYKTVPRKYHLHIKNQMRSTFEPGKYMELVDKLKISQMRIAKIIENIGGRIHLEYDDDGDDFWCHQNSEIIHPLGWSKSTGHDIATPKANTNAFLNALDASRFKKPRPVINSEKQFRENMKLEAIDPLNLSAICVASVVKVLRNDYLMIKIDGYRPDDSDMFCYSRTSSMIFPAGFCERNKLPLQAPYGYQGEFVWEKYLKETNSEFAPADLFWTEENFKNPFKPGMKLECVDLMNPQKICGGTVTNVVNRLIRINFDGWGSEYDQWVDCESCDIYPIGWCHLNNYHLEPPKQVIAEPTSTKKKARPKISKKTA